MPRDDQAEVQPFGFDRSVVPGLAGQEDIGRGRRGVPQRIVAGAADDGHAPDASIRLADDLHPRRTQ